MEIIALYTISINQRELWLIQTDYPLCLELFHFSPFLLKKRKKRLSPTDAFFIPKVKKKTALLKQSGFFIDSF